MPSTTVNGVSLYYEVEGDGPPLLLIAGLGSSSLAWAAAVPRLREGYTVITVDNRGTGRSEVPPGPYAVDDLADDTAALVDHLGLGPVAAVGWSLGGSVLQSMVIRHARVLSKAVLLNAFPSYTAIQDGWLDAGLALRRAGVDPVAIGMHAMPWAFTPRLLSDHAVAAAQAELARKDPYPTTLAGFEAQAAGLRRYDSRPDLPSAQHPDPRAGGCGGRADAGVAVGGDRRADAERHAAGPAPRRPRDAARVPRRHPRRDHGVCRKRCSMTRPLHVVGLGGTVRTGSSSEQALRIAVARAAAQGASTRVFGGSELAALPMYAPRRATEGRSPVTSWRTCAGPMASSSPRRATTARYRDW